MANISIWERKCPYCKSRLGISIGKDDKKGDKLYEEHLLNCDKYKESKKQMKKELESIRELQHLGLSMNDIKLLLYEDIEKDIKKLLKKFKIDKEQLIDTIESME